MTMSMRLFILVLMYCVFRWQIVKRNTYDLMRLEMLSVFIFWNINSDLTNINI